MAQGSCLRRIGSEGESIEFKKYQTEIIKLKNSNAELKQSNVELKKRNAELEAEIAELKQQIALLKKELYGSKSEKKRHAPRIPKIEKTASKSPPSGRKPLPEDLEREAITHDIPTEEKKCPDCGTDLKEMPPVITEQLAFRPAKLYVKRHERKQYVCPKCHEVIKTAKLPDQPIDKGLPDAALLAEVVINKYQDALPLYRQMKRWERLGYALSDTTLSDWVQTVAQLFSPLVEEMEKDVLRGRKVNADETPISILEPIKTHRGYMWVYVGEGATVYRYSPSRAYRNAEEFLKEFKGYVQADAYGAYDSLCDGKDRTKIGCWAHCRRRFNDVLINQPEHEIAKEAIRRIGELYQIEEELSQVSDEDRVFGRQARAGPLLKDFRQWLESQEIFPKSAIGRAIQYALNQWETLERYLGIGWIGLDNNVAERAIRPIKLGEKNYLFAGSHRAAKNAAVLYALIETCKMHHINTANYFQDVLERLPTTLNKDIRTLLPYNWAPSSAKSADSAENCVT
jgi:transposase